MHQTQTMPKKKKRTVAAGKEGDGPGFIIPVEAILDLLFCYLFDAGNSAKVEKYNRHLSFYYICFRSQIINICSFKVLLLKNIEKIIDILC